MRWFGEFFFLSIILVAYILDSALKLAPQYAQQKYIKHSSSFLFIGLTVIIFLSWPSLNTSGLYVNSSNDNAENVFDYMQGKHGRVFIENHQPDQPTSVTFDAKIGPLGDGVGTFILRESSISNLYTVPVRNSISQNPELWGVRSFKGLDKALFNNNIDETIDRAASMGVQYFLIRTSLIEEYLTKSKRVTLEKDFGNWKLFSLKTAVPTNGQNFAQVLKYEPVLLYSHLNFKDRKVNEYNYSRFQEELFLGEARDTILVSPKDMRLDTSTDLDHFKTAVLSDYIYKDIDAVYKKLEEYSRTNTLVLVFSADPLFEKLSLLASSHRIFIAPRNINENDDNIFTTQKNFKALLDMLDRQKIPVVGAANASIKKTSITASHINVGLETNSENTLPILVKESYFPTWKRDDGEVVYLATPTFMLTFAKRDFDLTFTTDSSVYIGSTISLLTLLIVLGFIARDRKYLFKKKISKQIFNLEAHQDAVHSKHRER